MTSKPNTTPEPEIPFAESGKPPRKKESWTKLLLRVFISVAVIAVGILVILLGVAKAGHYDSIAAMWEHMAGEVAIMWQRIRS